MFTALDVIVDAYERCNRLSPGETLGADDAAFGFRRLNLLVDEMSARPGFLFQSLLTTAAQTGNITLGAGAWASLAPGDDILSASVDGVPMSPLTMRQFNAISTISTTGTPRHFLSDGLGTVYLYPVPNGQTVRLETRRGVSQFADQNGTSYTAPAGYKAALGAGLAVRIAPTLLGGVPAALAAAERRCMDAIDNYEPAIVDTQSFDRGGQPFHILTGGA